MTSITGLSAIAAVALLATTHAGCRASSKSLDRGVDGGPRDGSATKLGRAVELDGTNWVSLPPTGNYIPASGFTWELWFSGDSLPTDTAVKDYIGPYPPQEILFAAADGQFCVDVNLGFGAVFAPSNKLSFAVDGPGGCGDRDTTPIGYVPPGGFENGRWYHVAAVRNYGTSSVSLYVDGTLVANKTLKLAAINGAGLVATIGRFADGINDWAHFHGAIDEVRVYNRPLSAQEIAAHYNAGDGSYGTGSEAGLLAGWHLDETAETIATDFGPAHLDGTYANAPAHVEGVAPGP